MQLFLSNRNLAELKMFLQLIRYRDLKLQSIDYFWFWLYDVQDNGRRVWAVCHRAIRCTCLIDDRVSSREIYLRNKVA